MVSYPAKIRKAVRRAKKRQILDFLPEDEIVEKINATIFPSFEGDKVAFVVVSRYQYWATGVMPDSR